jgi:hypothetical protein
MVDGWMEGWKDGRRRRDTAMKNDLLCIDANPLT